MNLAPVVLQHGERFGRLTVLHPLKSDSGKRGQRYMCACECGYQKVRAKVRQLMSGAVTACVKCSGQQLVKLEKP